MLRDQGIGQLLLEDLERWAAEHQITQAWVGSDAAAGFYQRCGWTRLETFTTAHGWPMTVSHKQLP